VRARLLPVLRSTFLLLLALAAVLGAASPVLAAKKHDLTRDEKRGGHTLARHVGLSDAQLRERLRKDPRLSAASTFTDRAAAEETVTAALARGKERVDRWVRREGSRANLVLDFAGTGRVIGRSLRRGDKDPVPCTRALVVLKWNDESEIYYVLTSYPEASR
jgi:hypothetical protein